MKTPLNIVNEREKIPTPKAADVADTGGNGISVIVYVKDDLTAERRRHLVDALLARKEITHARFAERRARLLFISYDAARYRSWEILQHITRQHVRAALVGL
jgi:hypothetical protein